VSAPPQGEPKEGDELWFGLVGPIRVSDADSPERTAQAAAGRVAQAAHSWDDLASLVRSHPDHRVREQAIPRLRARFPDDTKTLDVLVGASVDGDAGVRESAVFALEDLRGRDAPAAADAIAARLSDAVFEVRLSAAQALHFLGDDRAPEDPEVWALNTMLPPDD
jgi:HEAT repeat protein